MLLLANVSFYLDDPGKDLSSILSAGCGCAHTLLLQEEVDQPSDESHTRSQVLIPRRERAFIVA